LLFRWRVARMNFSGFKSFHGKPKATLFAVAVAVGLP
jgi:hypothetical protein